MPDPARAKAWQAEDFAAHTGVSHETLARLKLFADLLLDWNSRHNLVSEASLEDVWRRHFWDSAQLAPLIPPSVRTLADLGSGAGFPALVLAALRPDIAVTCHEATAKKCAFLQAAVQRMGLAVTIQKARIEALPPRPYDAITARALAPLPKLLSYAWPFFGPNSVCFFLKGQNLGVELTEAHKYWSMKATRIPSQTDPSGAILKVQELGPHEPIPSQKATHSGRRQSEGRRR